MASLANVNNSVCLISAPSDLLLTVYVLCSFFQLQENQDEIENMMNAIFKGVFVHRYR